METLNKKVKNIIDNLEKGDDITELDYLVEEIDGDLIYVSDLDFDTKWMDYGELFDELVEFYIDKEKEEWVQNWKQ